MIMIRKHRVRCIGLAVAVVVAPACSDGPERRSTPNPQQSLAERIDAQVSKAIHDGPQPGASVAVASDGNLLLAKGYGLADVKARVRARRGTVYRIGSVTKQFTAAAVMDLAE